MRGKTKSEIVRMNRYWAKLRTERQIAKGFGVALMTIVTWRNKHGMPAYVIPGDRRPAVRFDVNHVKEWAKANGKSYRDTLAA